MFRGVWIKNRNSAVTVCTFVSWGKVASRKDWFGKFHYMGRSYIGASLFHMCTEETWHVSFAAAVEQAMDRYSQGAFFSSHIKDLFSILGFYCQCAFCLVLFLFFETNQPKQSVGPTCLFCQALSHLFLCHPSILKKFCLFWEEEDSNNKNPPPPNKKTHLHLNASCFHLTICSCFWTL